MRAEPSHGESDAREASRFEAGEVLRELARPRMTGSEGAAETAAAIRARFESSGYVVEDRPFTFNPWLGRFGISAIGALYLAATFAASLLLFNGHAFGAISLLLILVVVVALLAFFASAIIDRLPWGYQEGVNLYAAPPGGRPRYIVMAHRDSKSQPVPLAFRGPAIALGIIVWVTLLVAATFHTARPLPGSILLVLGIAAMIAGTTLVFCWTGNQSPGALDNASGVAAAIGLAGREREQGDVAFLITDAEELGLAGARAAAPHLPAVFGVINIDGLDDHGPFYIFERFGTIRRRGLAPHMAAALLQEAASLGLPVERRDLPFGIPVDHIPIVKAGKPALTLMRGTLRSLQRVHSSDDDIGRLRGDGVTRAVDLVAGALQRMREQARALES